MNKCFGLTCSHGGLSIPVLLQPTREWWRQRSSQKARCASLCLSAGVPAAHHFPHKIGWLCRELLECAVVCMVPCCSLSTPRELEHAKQETCSQVFTVKTACFDGPKKKPTMLLFTHAPLVSGLSTYKDASFKWLSWTARSMSNTLAGVWNAGDSKANTS